MAGVSESSFPSLLLYIVPLSPNEEEMLFFFSFWLIAGVYKMVMSVGWNPFYNNDFKTVEPHLIHDFGDEQLYGQELRLTVCGYIRPEANFESLDQLIARIRQDIHIADTALDQDPFHSLRGDEFLVGNP